MKWQKAILKIALGIILVIVGGIFGVKLVTDGEMQLSESFFKKPDGLLTAHEMNLYYNGLYLKE